MTPTIVEDMDTQVVRRNRKYPVTLTPAQILILDGQSSAAITVWNLLHAYTTFHAHSRRWPTLAMMDAAIRQGRKDIDFLAVLPAQAAQAVLKTYRQAWKNYWAGTHARPDFHAKRRTRRAVDIPQARDLNLQILNGRWATVQVPKVGRVKVRLHQSPPDRITGARLVKEAGVNAVNGGWFLVLRGENEIPAPDPDTRSGVLGIDVGVTHTLADSEGNFIDQGPTLTPGEARRLYRLQVRSARQRRTHVKGTPVSNRLQATYTAIGALKARQARRRHDFAHQASAALASLGHATYAIEDLRIKAMTATAKGTAENPGSRVAQKAGLNRAILDQGWAKVTTFLGYKADQAGATVVRVRPHGTSQECHRCGSTAPGQRESQASFRCAKTTCGWAGNADYNAARNIAKRGQSWLADQTRRQEVPSQDVEPIGISRAVKRQLTRGAA